MSLAQRTVLITGGTGSFGRQFVRTLLASEDVAKVIVYSRDELKQHEMAQEFEDARLRFFLGDVRDRDRLYRAFDGVDIVVHAAALKQVPAAEYNPFEVIKTNVLGAQNIIDAAIDRGVEKVIALSTDKAAAPINLYGASKLCSDKLFTAANAYAGKHRTNFAVVRYGNVMGSRGSVVPFFVKKRLEGQRIPITDPKMTRFWITLPQGVEFVLDSLEKMSGTELFIPRIPSMHITDLAQAIAPDTPQEIVGIRPGEKLHEVMITEDDAAHTLAFPSMYVLLPAHRHDLREMYQAVGGKSLPEGFRYASNTNDEWLTIQDIRRMVSELNIDGFEVPQTPVTEAVAVPVSPVDEDSAPAPEVPQHQAAEEASVSPEPADVTEPKSEPVFTPQPSVEEPTFRPLQVPQARR